MIKIKQAFILGLLDWFLPFVVSFIIFPLRQNNYFLFESSMSVLVTFSAVWFAKIYFTKNKEVSRKEGLYLGLMWLVINLIIDLILFLPKSPMQTSFILYMSQIGIKYLSIPIITIGFSLLNKNKDN